MREEEKIFAGKLYFPGNPELKALKLKAHNLSLDYNRLHEDETEQREAILTALQGHRGERCFFQGPITFHYGCHTSVGDDVFVNFNFTVQDDAKVTIGDRCDFGPNVTIVTPLHPMLPEERHGLLNEEGVPTRLCWARPVTIGNDCWFGANVVVCPGGTIGDGCVIGAGSVVTRDIPPHSFAAGNPCRVIRTLGAADSLRNRPELLGGCSVREVTGAHTALSKKGKKMKPSIAWFRS